MALGHSACVRERHSDFRLTGTELSPVRPLKALGKDGAASHLCFIRKETDWLGLSQNKSDHNQQRWHPQPGKRVNRHAVRAPVVDLEEPEGATKWGFVSGCMAGLRHRHDSLPKSKESQIRALEKGRHQHSSSSFSLGLNSTGGWPDPADQLQCGLGLLLTLFGIGSREEHGHVTKLATRRFR